VTIIKLASDLTVAAFAPNSWSRSVNGYLDGRDSAGVIMSVSRRFVATSDGAPDEAMYNRPDYGPTFSGGGHNLEVDSKLATVTSSWNANYYKGNLTSAVELMGRSSAVVARMEVFSLRRGNDGIAGADRSRIASDNTFVRLTWAITRFSPMIKRSKPGTVVPRPNLWANCYKQDRDGANLERLRTLCTQKGPSVVLIETRSGNLMAVYNPFGLRPADSTADLGFTRSYDSFVYNLRDHSTAYSTIAERYGADDSGFDVEFGGAAKNADETNRYPPLNFDKSLTSGTCSLDKAFVGYAAKDHSMCGGSQFTIKKMEVWYLNLDLGTATFAEGEKPSAIATSGQIGAMVFAAGLEAKVGRCKLNLDKSRVERIWC